MDWKIFLLRVTVALILGALIGSERQLRQRLTGLRTNALVSTGACLFVLMTQSVPGIAADASRVAAYVVSGIGFLGGGVIVVYRGDWRVMQHGLVAGGRHRLRGYSVRQHPAARAGTGHQSAKHHYCGGRQPVLQSADHLSGGR